MSSTFLRLVMILAMLVAPVGMMRAHAAMAAPSPAPMGEMTLMATAGHCADMDEQPKDRPGQSIDCTIACSGLPTASAAFAFGTWERAAVQPLPCVADVDGLQPESDPPPPRFA